VKTYSREKSSLCIPIERSKYDDIIEDRKKIQTSHRWCNYSFCRVTSYGEFRRLCDER